MLPQKTALRVASLPEVTYRPVLGLALILVIAVLWWSRQQDTQRQMQAARQAADERRAEAEHLAKTAPGKP